jgi:hypothetical protein
MAGKYFLKKIGKTAPDISSQELVSDIRAICAGENRLDGSANIVSRVDESAVHVEQINRELRNRQSYRQGTN